jgi:pachytene checkpoint protein 2
MLKVPVHVEVEVVESCSVPYANIQKWIKSKIQKSCPILREGPLEGTVLPRLQQSDGSGLKVEAIQAMKVVDGEREQEDESLAILRSIKRASICELGDVAISIFQAELIIYVYTLSDSEPEKDFLDGEEEIFASEQWELPNNYLAGLWESIIVDSSIKRQLLGYCSTSIAFADAGIDPNIISWNRMALLYGPPGTGKTSLCKALAQKAYIRSSGMHFSSGILIEINAHSLFSKWFSESGKLVMKMFEHVREIAEDADCFVCILIDEVESLTASRSAASESNEPGDAVRVVNAVLTSLDALRRLPNVLVLCTSNMIEGIDPAFRDRLDVALYIGNPNRRARRAILVSCLTELMNKGIIRPAVTFREGEGSGGGEESTIKGGEGDMGEGEGEGEDEIETLLHSAVMISDGLSGRALRKLAVRAHAFHVQRAVASCATFLSAMVLVLQSAAADALSLTLTSPSSTAAATVTSDTPNSTSFPSSSNGGINGKRAWDGARTVGK